MNEQLKKAFVRKESLLKLEKHLLEKAYELYALCLLPAHKRTVFEHITPSQMAALGDCILTASSLKEAKEKISHFLDKQLERLGEKESSSKVPSSWLTQVGKDKVPLGSLLKKWLVEEDKYLNLELILVDELIDDLQFSAPRRFWSDLYGLYRYEDVFKEPMILKIFDSVDRRTINPEELALISGQEVNQP